MLGYEAAELKALTYQDLTPANWREFEQRIVTEQILTRGFSDVYEKEYRRKDGTVFPVELHTTLLRNPDGEPVAMWGTVRDITERKRAEEAAAREEAPPVRNAAHRPFRRVEPGAGKPDQVDRRDVSHLRRRAGDVHADRRVVHQPAPSGGSARDALLDRGLRGGPLAGRPRVPRDPAGRLRPHPPGSRRPDSRRRRWTWLHNRHSGDIGLAIE